MSSQEIESNLEKIIAHLNKDDFIYDFLIAYGISKSIVTRLKKGDPNEKMKCYMPKRSYFVLRMKIIF